MSFLVFLPSLRSPRGIRALKATVLDDTVDDATKVMAFALLLRVTGRLHLVGNDN